MDLDYTFHPGEGYAEVTVQGTVYTRDLLVAMHTVLGDARWAPGTNALWDYSAVEAVVIAYEDIAPFGERAQGFRQRFGPGRAAFVYGREEDRDVMRLLLIHAAQPDRERRLFDDRAEALTWIRKAAT